MNVVKSFQLKTYEEFLEGNATAVPIIRRLGMALGILIWNTTNCLSGWAGGNFGLFGMKARPAANPLLNYVGLACVIVG